MMGRDRGQASVRLVSNASIMRSAAFQRGVEDKRAGRHPCYDANDDWSYERGRQWAALAPMTTPLRVKGKLSPKALALFVAAMQRRYII